MEAHPAANFAAALWVKASPNIAGFAAPVLSRWMFFESALVFAAPCPASTEGATRRTPPRFPLFRIVMRFSHLHPSCYFTRCVGCAPVVSVCRWSNAESSVKGAAMYKRAEVMADVIYRDGAADHHTPGEAGLITS
jgi:hypothetical protein